MTKVTNKQRTARHYNGLIYTTRGTCKCLRVLARKALGTKGARKITREIISIETQVTAKLAANRNRAVRRTL